MAQFTTTPMLPFAVRQFPNAAVQSAIGVDIMYFVELELGRQSADAVADAFFCLTHRIPGILA
jgi:hypothetical protein